MSPYSRRDFLAGAAAAAALAAIPSGALAYEPLYPPVDLSYFDAPIPDGPEIHIGYAAITWNGNDRQAMEDIAALGFRGIQLRSNVLNEFPGGAGEVRDLLEKHNLTMVALSSGGVGVDGGDDKAEVAKHVSHARFVHDVGGHYMQVTDNKPKRGVASDDYQHLGKLMTEIGKQSADLGVPLGYHNHMGSMGERPEEVERILDATDPRYVKLELDVAHYFQGGGNPVKAIEQHKDRLLFLHMKDVTPQTPSATAKNPYVFVELGQGKVDIPGVFAALKRVGFHGWAVVELDGNPEKEKNPKQGAMVNKQYLEKLGIKL